MVNPELKEEVKGKLNLGSSVARDIQESKVKVRINNVEQVDGKITATYCLSGIPTKKDSNESSYQDIPKIFNNINAFTAYTKNIFSMDDDAIVKLVRGGDKS